MAKNFLSPQSIWSRFRSKMFIIYAGLFFIITCTLAHQEYPPLSKPCQLGDTTSNDCLHCVCTNNHYFDCTSKPCNKSVVQNYTDHVSCEPSMLYVKNDSVCLCKPDGSWPHKACKTIFNTFPLRPISNCEPDSFVIIDCNVCRCGLDGRINKKRCTRNKCKITELAKNRRYIKQNQVYGSCEAENWYSLAPCQFCFCVSENKLVCNTGHTYSKKLQLGSYNLNICGKDLVKDALGLLPDKNSNLRIGDKLSIQTVKTEELKGQNPEALEFNNNNNQNINTEVPYKSQEKKDSEEYYVDSNEIKSAIAKDGHSTKLPYEEDENNSSSESEEEKQTHTPKEPNILVPVQTPVDTPQEEPVDAPAEVEAPVEAREDVQVHLPVDIPVDIRELQFNEPPKDIGRQEETTTPAFQENDFPQHFEWPENSDQAVNANFNLGDVLKPYLPVVLDKVFQMALRKSMVSIDANANCNPGSTTVFKCNACFCMKNKRLLCTNNRCE